MFSDFNFKSLPQLHSDNLLPSVNRWTHLFGMILLFSFGGLAILVAVFRYNAVVKASATVRPLGEVSTVQARIEGAVTQIHVQENQVIKQGEPIVSVNDSPLRTQILQYQESLRKTKQQQIQIDAQIAALDRQVTAERKRVRRSVASAQAQLQLNQRNYHDQKTKTEADVLQAEASLELAKEELHRFQQLASTGAIPQLQLKEKESALKIATAQLASARASLNPSAASLAIANEEIAQRQSEGQASIENLTQDREALIQQRVQLENQLSFDQQQIAQLQRDLKSAIVRSPVNGIILQLNIRSTSQVVQAKDTIAQVIPSNAPLIIKAYVPAEDINHIAVGQQVQMRVVSCAYSEFGTLQGTVHAISPDAVSQAQNQNQNQSAYEVTVQPKTLTLIQGTRRCRIQPGMEGRADIITREETVLQFLLRKARLIADV